MVFVSYSLQIQFSFYVKDKTVCSFYTQKIDQTTDYGHPEIAFFQKIKSFGLGLGLGQTNWAEILGGIWAISGQTISTILAL